MDIYIDANLILEKMKTMYSAEVLIIEDNELLRDSLKEVINNSDSITCENTFSSGEVACEVIKKKELVPDIILLDNG